MKTIVELRATPVPTTPAEIVDYLRECACVDDRGLRRMPNWLDDEVFNAAADMIEKYSDSTR
ncbi:hypothetical protein [Brucella intermedia]|uniref:hypothetical protein n=1 Tax=Brucella intermedia TaxID=94625 RepID=UPI0034CEFC61